MQIFGPQNCFGGRRGDFVKLTFTMLQWYLKCYKEQIEITSCDLLLFQPRQHNLRDHQRSVQQVRSSASRRLRRLQLQRVGRSQGWASRYLFIIWWNIKHTCGLLNFWILFPQILGQTNHLMLQECLLATTTGSPVSASLRTAWRCGNYFFTLHFSISLNFASRCALGPGTHSWRSGTKQEWFDSVQLNSSFLQNFPLNNLWRPDLKEEPSHNWNGHLYVPPSSMISKKGILGTVLFRFEMTTVSNLESQYPKTCQIARLWVPFARLSLLWLRGPQHLLSRILGFEAVIRFATSDSNKGSESLRALNFQSRECWGPFILKIDKSSAWKPKSKIISVVSN